MRLTMDSATLATALGKVCRAAERSSTIPILQCVLLEAEASKLKLSACDMSLWCAVEIEVAPEQTGALCVNALALWDVARNAEPGSQMSLSLDSGQLKIAAGKARFSLPTLPAEDFPKASQIDGRNGWRMGGKTLADALSFVECAMSTEEARYYLCGALLERCDAGLRIVATTGHVLHRIDVTAEVGGEPPEQTLLPRQAVSLIATLCGGAEAVLIAATDSLAMFTWDGVAITTKLIDATFPQYERVIPERAEQRGSVMLAPAAFLAALRRVQSFGEREGHNSAIYLRAEESRLLLAGEETSGSGLDEIEVEYEGDPIEAGFVSRYLSTSLESFGKVESLCFSLADHGTPALVTVPGDESRLAVVMPFRLRRPQIMPGPKIDEKAA